MARSTINQTIKSKYIGTTLTISDVGDDSNRGFDGPIASWERFQEILNTYNFNNDTLTVTIANVDAVVDLNGSSVQGLNKLDLQFTTDQTQDIDVKEFYQTFVQVWAQADFIDAEITMEDCYMISVLCSGVMRDYVATVANLRRAIFCQYVVSYENITNGGSPVVNVADIPRMRIQYGTFTNVDGVRLIECQSGETVYEHTGTIPAATGNTRLVNLASGFGFPGGKPDGSHIIYDLATHIVEEVFPSNTQSCNLAPSTLVNGTTIRGSFVDNAAALAAGVEFNHFYYNTTIGAVSMRT